MCGFKRIDRKLLPAFWREHDEGKRRRTQKRVEQIAIKRNLTSGRYFDANWGKEPVWVTLTILGTVRRFISWRNLTRYIKAVVRVNRWGTTQPHRSFIYVPHQIIDIDHKNNRILERVYLSPSIERVKLAVDVLYSANLKRKLAGRNLTKEQINQSLRMAVDEIYETGPAEFEDRHPFNIVVHDFDKKTGLPLITIVDYS